MILLHKTCFGFLFIFALITYAGPNSAAFATIDFEISTKEVNEIEPDEGNGSEIVLAVTVCSVSCVDSYSFIVEYDPDILSFVWAKNSISTSIHVPFLESLGGSTGMFMVKKSINEIDIASSLIGTNENEAPSGDGIVAFLKFKRKQGGDGKIRLKNFFIVDSFQNLDTTLIK